MIGVRVSLAPALDRLGGELLPTGCARSTRILRPIANDFAQPGNLGVLADDLPQHDILFVHSRYVELDLPREVVELVAKVLTVALEQLAPNVVGPVHDHPEAHGQNGSLARA